MVMEHMLYLLVLLKTNSVILASFLGGQGTHIEVLRAYFCLCAQGKILVGLE